MHRILALGLRISKYCWEDLTHYSRCRYYPYQEGQKRSWSAVGGCRGMSRERSKCTIQVGKRQGSVQQHPTSLTGLFASNLSGALSNSTMSWRTDLVRFIVLVGAVWGGRVVWEMIYGGAISLDFVWFFPFRPFLIEPRESNIGLMGGMMTKTKCVLEWIFYSLELTTRVNLSSWVIIMHQVRWRNEIWRTPHIAHPT